MNSFKIKSIDSQFVIVEWTVNGKTYEEGLDARYVPLEAEALNTELTRLLTAMAADVPAEIPAETTNLIGETVTI